MKIKSLKAIFALTVGIITAHAPLEVLAATSSYTITVPANDALELAAYSFASDTIANIFPSPTTDTVVYLWNVTNQNYQAISYEFGTWSSTNATLNPGDAFFIKQSGSSAVTFTISGTIVSGSPTLTLQKGNKLNYVGNTHPDNLTNGNFMQCQGTHYTTWSLGYVPDEGDKVYTWNTIGQNWVENSYEFGSWSTGTEVSPLIPLGKGVVIKPAGSSGYKTWTPTPTECE